MKTKKMATSLNLKRFSNCITYTFVVDIIHALGTNLKSIVKQADS